MSNLNGLNTGANNGDYGQQIGFHNLTYAGTNGVGGYWHFKTNISCAANDIVMIEAKGYNYGSSSVAFCTWGLYAWNNTLYNRGADTATGTTVQAYSMYKSSDNYAVIVAYCPNWYFTGLVFNGYTSNGNVMNYGHPQLAITTSTLSATSDAVY